MTVPRGPVFELQSIGRSSRMLPSLLDSEFTRFVSSGRAAISLALRLLEIGPGDQVMVPTYHCPTMISPIIASGAEPCFYPIHADAAPNLEFIDANRPPNAKAILVAHFFGRPQRMSEIRAYCDKRNIALIEDCAHALYGSSDGRAVGSWGDVAIGSLTKFFPLSHGGLIASRKLSVDRLDLHSPGMLAQVKAVVDILEIRSRYGSQTEKGMFGRAFLGLKNVLHGRTKTPPNYLATPDDSVFAFDAAAATMSPAWVCRALTGLTSDAYVIGKRQQNYQRFASRLSGKNGMSPLFSDISQNTAPYVFPLQVDSPSAAYRALREADIPVFRWDWQWPQTPDLPDDHGKRWASSVLQFPCHQSLTEESIDYVCRAIEEQCLPGNR